MAFTLSPVEFFTALHGSGIATVTREDLAGSEGETTMLRVFEETQEDLVGDLADLKWEPQTAVEALRYFYRICQALVDRAMSDEEVTSLSSALPAVPSTAGEILAADMTLRHLPDLHAMAKSMSSGDPLVTGISQAAQRFPLSSVGIPLEDPLPDGSPLQRHAGLWRLYIDRIIERQDVSRLGDERVRLAVVDALGEHALKLAPKLAAHLALTSSAESNPSSLS
jgi:hypothetical protein